MTATKVWVRLHHQKAITLPHKRYQSKYHQISPVVITLQFNINFNVLDVPLIAVVCESFLHQNLRMEQVSLEG